MLAYLLLVISFGAVYSSIHDDSLPIYLRGLKWDKVEEYLKEDLCLSGDVVPSNYAIELSVNVRGTEQAEKSDFNGTVTIYLDIIRPTNKIELHSNGLTIVKAELMESEILSNPIRVANVSSNPERETFIVHANRTIQANEKFMLQLTYRGVAILDGNGLYENWDPKFNKSIDNNGPFILAMNNFPTGARFWFPCFDELDTKATFELQVNHPSRLNAYANSELERTEDLGNGRTLSTFEKTRPLSTYQVALSINHYPTEILEVEGFKRVRLIRSANSHDYWMSFWVSHPRPQKDLTMDVPALIKSNLDRLAAMEFGHIPAEKLDIIILEGTIASSVQPGLITIGRSSMWSSSHRVEPRLNVPDLAQLRVGTQIGVRSMAHLYLNAMFSHLPANESIWRFRSMSGDLSSYGHTIMHASLHERPLREDIVHLTSTKQYLTSRMELPSLKASNLLKLLLRFCSKSKETIQKYITGRSGGFTEIDGFIEAATENCSAIAKQFLIDFIDQPGKAFLTVKRGNNVVTIEQTRYHSSYFDSNLRDKRTRYTIPIFYSIEGEFDVKVMHKNDKTITIPVPADSLFLIDHEYDHLYFVYYEDVMAPERNVTEAERVRIVPAVTKGMLAAVNIGYVKHARILEQLNAYVDRQIFGHHGALRAYEAARHLVRTYIRRMHYEEELYEGRPWNAEKTLTFRKCSGREWPEERGLDWNAIFNNGSAYWRKPNDVDDMLSESIDHMQCAAEWTNWTTYRSFLERNFLGENTEIRPDLISRLPHREIGLFQWRGPHRLFFEHAGNQTSHRFDLLADTVLNQARMKNDLTDVYPDLGLLRDEYLIQLRDFVLRHPKRAASMSTEIAMRLEREFIRVEQPKWHDYEDAGTVDEEYVALSRRAAELPPIDW